MLAVVLGLLLWVGSHGVAIYGRDRLSGVGDWWRGAVAAANFAAIALFWWGWNSDAGLALLYVPPVWGVHLNNALMLVAVWLVSAGHMKTNTARHVRHPMLLALVVWSIAHLLVNGNVQDAVLFGGLGVWALVSIFAINRRDGAWARPEPRPRKKDLIHLAATLVAFVAIVLFHWKIGGVYPLPG